MTPVTCFAGKYVALFGLGGSGLSTARALIAGGARVDLWDDNRNARTRAKDAGFLLTDLSAPVSDRLWDEFDSLVLAPGVPLTHPKPHWTVERARQAGVEVIGDIELFCRERSAIAPQAPFVAITGTNGKSTATALTAHVLHEAGADVQLGGNIGIPILDLEPPANDRIHVIEISSFQIDLAPSLNPSVGILLNVSPDHIDRHGTLENYAKVKEQLVAKSDVALISVDDTICWGVGERRRSSNMQPAGALTVPVSVKRTLRRGVFREGSQVVSTVSDDKPRVLCDLAGVNSLRGLHNAQNAAFASACADLWQTEDGVISEAVRSFPGLPHRLEEVGRVGRVLFINDSKATNAAAASQALRSFDEIYWIAGGQAKEGGVSPLLELLGNVKKVYLIGESADEFAITLTGHAEFERCGTLDVATAAAYRDALSSSGPESAILLSPACASFDQFTDYEARGDTFRRIVSELPGNDSQ